MEDRFKQLDSEFEHKDTVLSFLPSSMFKVGEFMLVAKEVFQYYGLTALKEKLKPRGAIPGDSSIWSGTGVPCEILSPKKNGWRKGKVRIKVSLEFCPDEPEVEETDAINKTEINQAKSPLDDIRQMANGNS